MFIFDLQEVCVIESSDNRCIKGLAAYPACSAVSCRPAALTTSCEPQRHPKNFSPTRLASLPEIQNFRLTQINSLRRFNSPRPPHTNPLRMRLQVHVYPAHAAPSAQAACSFLEVASPALTLEDLSISICRRHSRLYPHRPLAPLPVPV